MKKKLRKLEKLKGYIRYLQFGSHNLEGDLQMQYNSKYNRSINSLPKPQQIVFNLYTSKLILKSKQLQRIKNSLNFLEQKGQGWKDLYSTRYSYYFLNMFFIDIQKDSKGERDREREKH